MKMFKNLLTIGSIGCTTVAAANTTAVTDVLDPNSVNLLINAVLTVIVFFMRLFPKKEKNEKKK